MGADVCMGDHKVSAPHSQSLEIKWEETPQAHEPKNVTESQFSQLLGAPQYGSAFAPESQNVPLWKSLESFSCLNQTSCHRNVWPHWYQLASLKRWHAQLCNDFSRGGRLFVKHEPSVTRGLVFFSMACGLVFHLPTLAAVSSMAQLIIILCSRVVVPKSGSVKAF